MDAGEPTEEQGSPFDAAIVEELLRQLDKTVRLHQLYPIDNPTYVKTLDQLRGAFARIWQETGALTLEVSDTQLTWCGIAVLDEPEKVSDSLPWTLYKDGVREITLAAGFEGEELEALLNIIPLVRRAQDHEDDILTLFWEQEFVFLTYRFIDNVTTEGVPLDPSATPGRWPATPHVVREDPRAAVAEAKRRLGSGAAAAAGAHLDKVLGTPSHADESAGVPLAPSGAYMGYLNREIEREYATDFRHDVLDVLLDIFELQDDPAIRSEVAAHIDALSLHLLTSKEFGSVTHLLCEIAIVLERVPDLPPGVRERFEHLSDRVSDPVVLGPLLEAMDEANAPPPTGELNAFVDRLRPRALGTLFIWCEQAKHREVRELLASAADRLAQSGAAELLKLIGSDDQREALEAANRCAEQRLESAAPALVRLLGHREEDLRAAAVAALIAIGTSRAMHGVERALDDASRSVRFTAVRALTAAVHKPALPRVTELVTSRDVREMERGERHALFELYGTLCGDGGVPLLDTLLNGSQGFVFRRREDPQVRACAAAALGRVGSEKARETLRTALNDKDLVPRRAVARALGAGAS